MNAGLAILATFGAGVASFASPCVFPLVPAYVGMISDRATDERPGVVSGAIWFCLGLSAVFVPIGVGVGAAGGAAARLVGPIQLFGGVALIAFGLAKLGWLPRPPVVLSWRPRLHLPPAGHPLRPFVMGLAFGTTWTPCVGPILGAVLVGAAASGGTTRGGALLLVYAAGIGTPFLAAALALASSPAALDRLRGAVVPLQRVVGVALAALGVLLATGWYDTVPSLADRALHAVGAY